MNGGKADKDDLEDGCMNGGGGTIYYRFNDTLAVDNGELNSTAFTIVKIPEEKLTEEGEQ